MHIKKAEATHKQEKELFLKAGRAVDAFFKRRCDKLTAALAPGVSRLKAYRDQVALLERRRHEATRRAAEEEARRAAAEAEEHRAAAERLAREAQNLGDRRHAAEELQLAEAAAERAEIAGREATAPLEPTRIRGDYGALAYVTRSWTLRSSISTGCPANTCLDVEVVRETIAKDGIREIPGLRIFQAESLRVRGAA